MNQETCKKPVKDLVFDRQKQPNLSSEEWNTKQHKSLVLSQNAKQQCKWEEKDSRTIWMDSAVIACDSQIELTKGKLRTSCFHSNFAIAA